MEDREPQLAYKCAIAITAAAFFLLAFAAPTRAQSSEPIITFNQTHPLLNSGNAVPLVEVYADGRIVINRPPGMRNAGQYTLELSPQDIVQLLQLIQSNDILNFDEELVEQSNEETDMLVEVSDPTTSYFTIKRVANTGQLAEAGSDEPIEIQSIVVDEIPTMAEFKPDMPGIKQLDALQDIMIALINRAGE